MNEFLIVAGVSAAVMAAAIWYFKHMDREP